MKLFLSELQAQLKLVESKLAEIHIPRGPVAPPADPVMVARRHKLLERKRDLEEKIIFYDHDPDPSNPDPRPNANPRRQDGAPTIPPTPPAGG